MKKKIVYKPSRIRGGFLPYLYLAYGSNLNLAQFFRRCPAAA